MVLVDKSELFGKLIAAKRDWVVMEGSSSAKVVPGAEMTIQRGLCLRKMEIPVGQWLTDGIGKESHKIGKVGVELCTLNVRDEEKHDEQLDNVFNTLKLTDDATRSKIEAEGDALVQEWLKLGQSEHPILMSFVGEISIFLPLLTLFRRLGGTFLSNVSVEIGLDESGHVRTNGTISKEILGLTVSKELDELREATIQYIVQDLDKAGIPGKYGKSRTYVEASRSFLKNGYFKGFADTANAVQNCPFEIANANLPVYGSK